MGAEVWVRADGDELVVVAQDLAALPLRPDWAGPGTLGLAEVARHRLSVPGNPRIDLAHYPDHPQQPDGTPRPPRARPATAAEAAFLAIGDGARAWLTEAAAAGASRVRAEDGRGSQLAALAGTAAVDAALGTAAWRAGSATATCCPSPASRPPGPPAGRPPSLTRRTQSSPAPRPGPGSAP